MARYNKNQFLKEDIGLFTRGKGAFISHTQNSIDNTKRLDSENKGTKGGKTTTAKVGKMKGATLSKIFFRPPTKEELQADKIKAGDYQTPQIRIFSKILFDLDLVPEVYRTKSIDINKSNLSEIGRTKNVVVKLLKKYKDKQLSKNVIYKDMQTNAYAITDEIGAPPASLLYEIDEWDEVIENTPGLAYSAGLLSNCARFIKGRLDSPQVQRNNARDLLINVTTDTLGSASSNTSEPKQGDKSTENYEEDDEEGIDVAPKVKTGINSRTLPEPSQEVVDAVKKLYFKALKGLKKIAPYYATPKEFLSRSRNASSINAVFNRPIIKNIIENAFQDNSVKTIEDFENTVLEKLENSKVEKKLVTANTVIHEFATNNLREINSKMRAAGYKKGVKDIQQFFDYFRYHEPAAYEYFKKNYMLDDEKISSIKDWPGLMNYLYKTKGMLQHIDIDLLDSKNRARSYEDGQKGQELAVDLPKLNKQIEKLSKEIADSGLEEGEVSKVRMWENERVETERKKEIKLKWREILKGMLKKMKKEGASPEKIEKAQKVLNKVAEMVHELGRRVSTLKHYVKTAEDSDKEDLRVKLKELEAKAYKISSSVADAIENPEEARAFMDTLNKIYATNSEDEMPYKSSSFCVKAASEDVMEYLEKILDKMINKSEEIPDSGTEVNNKKFKDYKNVTNYINISFDKVPDEKYVYRIYLDYFESSNIYKKLKKEPEFIEIIIDKIVDEVKKEFPGKIAPIFDEETININEDF